MNNRKTTAELLANFHKTSAEGSLACNEMIDAFDGIVDDIAEKLDVPNLTTGRPKLITVPDVSHAEFIKGLVDSGCFIKITAEQHAAILSFIGDGRNITNHYGSAFTLKPVSEYTYSDCIIDAQSGAMTLSSIPGYKWNRVVMFHDVLEDGRTEFYLATKVLASTNNLVPADETRWLSLILDTIPNYQDETFKLWYLLTRDRFVPNYGMSNAKAAFNQYYALGYDPTSGSAASQTNLHLLELAFPAREGVDELYNEEAWSKEFNRLLSGNHVLYSDITSILKDISENAVLNTINEYITRTLGVLGGVANIQAFLSGITNPSALVQDYVNQLKGFADEDTGFVSKFLGLWAKAGLSSNNTSIGFTDNTTAVPQLFLSGIIASAIVAAASVIGTILSAIVTYVFGAIGIVVGAALFGIGSAVLNVIKKIDDTTYCGLDPSNSISAFNFAYFQIGDRADKFYTDIVEQIDSNGYAIISTAFSKTLLWRNPDTQVIESETHITPISYSDAQNIRAIISDSNILHNQGTDYTHYYLSGTSEQLATCRERLGKYTSNTPLGYDVTDSKNRDVWLKQGYIYAFCAYIIFLLCHQPYPQVIKPYRGETAAAWSDTNTAAAVDAAFNMYGANFVSAINTEMINGHAGSWPSWRQIAENDIPVQTEPTMNAYWYCFKEIKLSVIPWQTSPASIERLRTHMADIFSLMNYEAFSDIYYPAAYPTYVYSMPLVDRVSFIVGSIVVNLIIATVATTTAIVSTKVKKAKQRSAAKHAAAAENAWEDFKKNPSDKAAYDDYRKAVRSNNFAANFNGGSKLSKYSYWSDAGLVDDGGDAASSSLDLVLENQNKIYSSISGSSI